MRHKSLAAAILSIFTVPISAAQITGGSGGFTGILPLISQILGVDMSNPYQIVGVVATFGIMSIANYIILKKSFQKMDMLDVVNVGPRSDGRNILLILSILMTLSIAGTGAFMGIINGFRSVILLMFTFMLFGLLALVIGGSGTLGFGGLSYASGKGAKAAAEGLKQGAEGYKKAKEVYGEAKELTAAGEEDAEEGNLQNAEQEFENTVKLMEEVAPNLGEDFEGMESELEDAYTEYMDAVSDESDEEQRIGDIESRIKRVRLYLERVTDGSASAVVVERKNKPDIINYGAYWGAGSGKKELEKFIDGELEKSKVGNGIGGVNYPSEYGLAKVEEDIQKIQEDIKIAEKDYQDESGDLANAVAELEDVVERAIRAQSLIRKMINLLNELEKDSEEMEAIEEKRKLEQLHNASESMISEERKVEDIISQLEGYESNIESNVEKVLESQSKFLEFDDEEIEQLKQELKWESDLEPVVTELRQAFANSKGGATSIDDSVLDNGVSVMSDIIGKLSTLHDEMETMINQFEDEEREVYGRMESILGEAAENEDQNAIAHEIGDDLRAWLGEGNTRYT